MILRRVIAHFRKQEWAAIAIDFLIVVFGTDDQTRLKYVCDADAMRDDRAFLTFLAGNAQRYDAYVRVHLERWAAQCGRGFPRSGRRVV